MLTSGALSAVDPVHSLVPCLGALQVVTGHSSRGVGESSGIERLRDVPEFRRVQHRRKSVA
jgi:hypothetical protein